MADKITTKKELISKLNLCLNGKYLRHDKCDPKYSAFLEYKKLIEDMLKLGIKDRDALPDSPYLVFSKSLPEFVSSSNIDVMKYRFDEICKCLSEWIIGLAAEKLVVGKKSGEKYPLAIYVKKDVESKELRTIANNDAVALLNSKKYFGFFLDILGVNPDEHENFTAKDVLEKIILAIQPKILSVLAPLQVNGIFERGNKNEELVRLAKEVITGNELKQQPKAKDKFYIFLSALTKKKDGSDYTLEYKVALKLRDFFKEVGLGVFWWDDKDIKDPGFPIANKIALGLAFSTVFVGMSFDSVTPVGRNTYRYDSLLDERNVNAYKKINYFKYEVETFKKLCNEEYVEEFVNTNVKLVDKEDFDELIPRNRKLCFVTYGKPDSILKYKVLNDIDPIEVGLPERGESEDEQIKALVKQIVVALCKRDDRIRDRVLDSEYIQSIEYSDRIIADGVDRYFNSRENLDSVYKSDSGTPSDYYFKYAIFDERGINVSDKFTFFVEETGDASNLSLNLVINEWNTAFCKMPSYFEEKSGRRICLSEEYERGIHEFYPLAKYERVKIGTSDDVTKKPVADSQDYSHKKYTDSGCKIEIAGDIKSSLFKSGVLVFRDDDNTMKEKTYHFSVILIKKIKIYYHIEYRNRQVVFHFNKSLPENITEVFVCHSTSIPCQNEQTDAGTSIIKEKVSVESGSKYLKIAVTDFRDQYRLEFMPKDSPYNLFVYFPEKVKSDSDFSVRTRFLRCPYCARELSVKAKARVNGRLGRGVIDCQGNKIKKPLEWWFPSGVTSSISLKSIEKAYSRRIFCENTAESKAPKALPEKYINDCNGAVVTLLASSQVGKSTLISKIFGIRETGYEVGHGVSSYLASKVTPYIHDLTCLYPETPSYDIRKKDFVQLTPDDTEYRELMNKYVANPYESFVEVTSTEKETTKQLQDTPFVLHFKNRLNQGAYLTFFDHPGSRGNESKDLNLCFSDCIVVMIDPSRIDSIRNANKQIEANGSDMKGKPIAIVCSQFDSYENELSESRSLLRMIPPCGGNKDFKDSKLKAYIDLCSDELEAYLSTNIETRVDFANFKGKLSNISPCIKYFALSSLGRKDAVKEVELETTSGEREKHKAMYLAANPKGIENLLIWIAYQMGMIED